MRRRRARSRWRKGGGGPVVIAAGAVTEVDHDGAADELASSERGGLICTAGVGAQIHQPDGGLVVQFLNGSLDHRGGAGAKAGAVDDCHPIHQIIGDDRDEDRAALHRVIPPLPI